MAEQAPDRASLIACTSSWSAAASRRGRLGALAEQVVGGDDQAGPRRVGASSPLASRSANAASHSSTRVGWLPRMLRPMVWLIGTRLLATNAVLYRVIEVRKRTGRPMTPNHSCRASPRSWLTASAALPGDRQRRAEQVPHGHSGRPATGGTRRSEGGGWERER